MQTVSYPGVIWEPPAPIKTSYWAKPIPLRQFDWEAWRDGDEESGRVGRGSTKAEALASLAELEEEEIA